MTSYMHCADMERGWGGEQGGGRGEKQRGGMGEKQGGMGERKESRRKRWKGWE